MKNPIRKVVKIFDPDALFVWLAKRGMLNKMNDEAYLKRQYKALTKKKIDFVNPKSFNEKLQWLKLNDRKPIYTTMVDKYEAKKYVSDRLGKGHVIPTLGVWENFDDIDFGLLPNQFVLKCTHDSGGLSICRDKSSFDWEAARIKIEQSLARNYYWSSREWPYKNVKPRIIAEKFMSDDSMADGLTDYKFYCFNGEPRFLYISKGLENHETASISFLTLDWQFAPYERSDYKPFSELPKKPDKLDEMIEIARKLSGGIDFLRVDLYEINGEVYFSELTFSPCAGFMPFANPQHDLELGQMLNLTVPKA